MTRHATPAEYQPRRITITAVQWTGDNLQEIAAMFPDLRGITTAGRDGRTLTVRAGSLPGGRSEYSATARRDDWILRMPSGEPQAMPDGDFTASYERAPQAAKDGPA